MEDTPVTDVQPTPAGLWSWAVPKEVRLPPDELRARVDIYGQAIVLSRYQGFHTTTKVVSGNDIIAALMRDVPVNSGLLVEGALWWAHTRDGPLTALYRPPTTTRVALQTRATETPQRFTLPTPPLVFLCTPARAPSCYAVRERPTSPKDPIYAAPYFNVFDSGLTCQGSQKYPIDIRDAIDAFFTSFFSPVEGSRKSVKHPTHLLDLWKELDGQEAYPMPDLVQMGTVGDLLAGTAGRRRR